MNRRQLLKMAAAAGTASIIPAAFGQVSPSAPAAGSASTTGTAAAPAAAPTPTPMPLPPAPAPIVAPEGFGVAPGPFQPTLESLSAWTAPDWYRDAKLGIWAHWGPQCQPEMGDWYAQKMYQEGGAVYKFHCEKYGHPSKFGWKDVVNTWKAENWDPEALVARYKKAGAKFFAAMANHHDNLDMWDSKYQPWNSVAVGPKKNIIAGWEKAARGAGLKFALSSHGDRAWDWIQVSQGADKSGPLAGVPYDGRTPKSDGKGKWWDGLDPQDLYAQYHERGRYRWTLEGNPPLDPNYVAKFFNRTIDLIAQHNPDLLYFDDTVMPIFPTSDIGPRIAAYLYNTNMARNGGKLEALMTGKGLTGPNADWRKALVLDVERGVTNGGETIPWQTDTCIGSWHYELKVFEQHRYKTAQQVVQMFVDIVSKNGTLMLNIPLKGDGTYDSDEAKVLDGLESWIGPNGEGIYATRPWKVYGEGPSTVSAPRGQFGGARDVRPYTAEDVRYTAKGETVYAFLMVWPEAGKATLKSLAKGSEHFPKEIAKVGMLGGADSLTFVRDENGLTVTLPETKLRDYPNCLKIVAA